MDTLAILAYTLIGYGLLVLYVAFAKPKAIWKRGKIQGLVQLLSEKGTVLFFSIVGIAVIAGGVFMLIR